MSLLLTSSAGGWEWSGVVLHLASEPLLDRLLTNVPEPAPEPPAHRHRSSSRSKHRGRPGTASGFAIDFTRYRRFVPYDNVSGNTPVLAVVTQLPYVSRSTCTWPGPTGYRSAPA